MHPFTAFGFPGGKRRGGKDLSNDALMQRSDCRVVREKARGAFLESCSMDLGSWILDLGGRNLTMRTMRTNQLVTKPYWGEDEDFMTSRGLMLLPLLLDARYASLNG